MSARLSLQVQVACDGDDLPGEDEVRRWLQATLSHSKYSADQGCEIAVRFVDTEEGQALNRRYRQRDYASNVLSFPAGDEPYPADDEPLALGDLVLCVPVVRAEALEQHKPLHQHWAHLLVHGSLHLLGYDHEDEADATAMEQLETDILGAGGVPNPYLPRASG